MKRFIAIAATAVFCLACAACGCTNSMSVTEPSTMAPTTGNIPSTMPTFTVPSMETNIPDPEVNDNSTVGTDSTDTTEGTSTTEGGMNRSIMK